MATAPVNAGAQIFSRMQMLEQEVLELRGLVEQQAYEIKRLKQQRLDDYTDLDQRISGIYQGQVPNQGSNQGPTIIPAGNSSPASATQTGSVDPQQLPDERQLYTGALNLLLKDKDFDASAVQLDQYLEYFPEGLYAPNAFYWLGEIALSKQDLELSKQRFGQLIEQFPGHNKVPDAQFKLGKVYHQLGDVTSAKTLLTAAAGSGGSAANLARDYLTANAL
jgi:tol-pal system protein YbgF